MQFSTTTETLINEFRLIKGKGVEKPTSLIAENEKGEKVILCTLVPGINESIIGNILLQGGESFILSTTTESSIDISYLENSEITDPLPTTSLVSMRIKENEKVLLTGNIVYTLVSIVSSESKRLSLCLIVNGEEVTLGNLVPGRIETAEISLESFEDEEIELFLVGSGEVELVGYTAENETDEYTDCSECEEKLEDCLCEESEESEEINDNQFISDDKMENLVSLPMKDKKSEKIKKEKTVTIQEAPREETASRSKGLSKEERKKEERQKDLKEIKIVETVKSKNKQVAKKTDKIKIRYTLYVNNKLIEKNKGPGLIFRMGEGQMIRGLELGIEGMSVGSKRTITIPPHLGYGSTRTGGVPPNSVLVFLVELCAVLS